ncbi:hypothetical protein ON010_g15302 [Phytophthora cinnamomi]|nr:hypothetical protein ON010_g15302 [Phytophthora cinnamomi]
MTEMTIDVGAISCDLERGLIIAVWRSVPGSQHNGVPGSFQESRSTQDNQPSDSEGTDIRHDAARFSRCADRASSRLHRPPWDRHRHHQVQAASVHAFIIFTAINEISTKQKTLASVKNPQQSPRRIHIRKAAVQNLQGCSCPKRNNHAAWDSLKAFLHRFWNRVSRVVLTQRLNASI